MVLIPFGDGRYTCLSGDTKPTAGITSGSKLTEYGLTTIDYYFNGATWESQPEAIAGHITWRTDASGVIFSGLQRLPSSWAASYIIWVSGTTYQSMRTSDGVIQFSGTDPVTVFDGSIQALSATGRGGRIGIRAGDYTFTSGIAISGEGSIILTGEGGGGTRQAGTNLLFNAPEGSLISGAIKIRNHEGGLEYLNVRGNSGVSHLIQIFGNAQRGFIDHCYLDGASGVAAGAGFPYASGTVGVYIDGVTAATYYWKITNNALNFFERGIWLASGLSNAQMISNNTIDNTFIGIDVDSGLNLIANLYHQGHSTDRSGTTCVRFGANAFENVGTNVYSEQFSGVGSVIKFMPGTHKNCVMNVGNSASTLAGSYVLDYNESGSNNYNRIFRDIPSAPVLISGASPFSYFNDTGELQQITIGAGTVTGIDIIKNATTFATSGTGGAFIIQPGDIIRVTYSAAPKIYRMPI